MEPSKRPTDLPAAGNSVKMPRQDDGVCPSTSSTLLTFLCHLCTMAFTTAENLTRHIKYQHGDKSFTCPVCSNSFARKDTLDRHAKICTSKPTAPDLTCHDCYKTFTQRSSLTQHLKTHVLQSCDDCGKTFQTKVALTAHRKIHKTVPLAKAGDPQPSQDPRDSPSAACPPKGCKSALNGAYERYRAKGTEDDVDLPAFLHAQQHADIIRDALKRRKGVKFFVSANIIMTRPRNWITRGDPESRPYFTSRCFRVLEATNIEELLELAYAKIIEAMAEYLKEGSGWVVKQINFADLVISTYKPMVGSSYVELPSMLCFTKSIINVMNEDNKCFLWSVLSAIHPVKKDSQRVSNYTKHEHSLNLEGLTFPILVDDIPTFEKLNNLRINLFGYRDKDVFPLYVSEKTTKPINLLLISDDINQHYCWIRDFNGFMDMVTMMCKYFDAKDEREGSGLTVDWF